jgi:hypothetical protein
MPWIVVSLVEIENQYLQVLVSLSLFQCNKSLYMNNLVFQSTEMISSGFYELHVSLLNC